jgi:hypothetical protein
MQGQGIWLATQMPERVYIIADFHVAVQVKCRDRKGLLVDIINALKMLPLEVGLVACSLSQWLLSPACRSAGLDCHTDLSICQKLGACCKPVQPVALLLRLLLVPAACSSLHCHRFALQRSPRSPMAW